VTWQLSRPEAALPNSHFWTWDHSTNWMLDDPGMLTSGCYNDYLKRPETYVEDYRRLTDLSAGLGIEGIIIWGFLRDSHGGIENAKRVASYAASKGVAIMPGFGTTWYGGAYYQGNHKYNLETFLANTPDARAHAIDGLTGKHIEGGACPSSPAFLDWLAEAANWMFREFEIGGMNLENGDFVLCDDPRCVAAKQAWPKEDPEFFRLQAMSYVPALEALRDMLNDKLVTWATYSGFLPGKGDMKNSTALMHCDRPVIVDRVPRQSVCQWTITGMLREEPLPLNAYLDDGAPAATFDNPNWPAGLKPPSVRGCGFAHQGSQWSHSTRYDQIVSPIKEACLRAYRSGLEGVVIHGEVTSRSIPNALNYLAFSHFIHWPEDNLRDFGRKTLGQVLEDEDEGEAYAIALAGFDSGTLTDDQKLDIRKRADSIWPSVCKGAELERWRFWNWLSRVSRGLADRHTVSFF
jgi:hypothetical protein